MTILTRHKGWFLTDHMTDAKKKILSSNHNTRMLPALKAAKFAHDAASDVLVEVLV